MKKFFPAFVLGVMAISIWSGGVLAGNMAVQAGHHSAGGHHRQQVVEEHCIFSEEECRYQNTDCDFHGNSVIPNTENANEYSGNTHHSENYGCHNARIEVEEGSLENNSCIRRMDTIHCDEGGYNRYGLRNTQTCTQKCRMYLY